MPPLSRYPSIAVSPLPCLSGRASIRVLLLSFLFDEIARQFPLVQGLTLRFLPMSP